MAGNNGVKLVKRKLIMIIDDDEDDRDLFCLAVRKMNQYIIVVCSKNGKDAIELLSRENASIPDFIFLDLKMPYLDGKQTLIELKTINKLAQIPVIIYSSTKSAFDEEEVMKLGADYFLTKPYRFIDLVNSISCYFKRAEILLPFQEMK
jgi:Response regulator containing CheY-like receiver, AAA-type ATPase, and DNA-binding domains